MKKTIAVIFFLAVITESMAQPQGTADSIMSIKKTWIKKEPFVGAYDIQLKPAQFPLIYKRTDSIAALVKEAYPQPTGTDATWYTSIIGYPYFPGGPSQYMYSSMFKFYYYNKGLRRILRHEEPGTGVSVYVNGFRFLLEDMKIETLIDNQQAKVYKLLHTDGEWNGYPVYRVGEKYVGYKNYRVVFFGKNGRMPWKTVTKREYLEALRNKWRNDRDSAFKSQEEGLARAQKTLTELERDTKMNTGTREKLIKTAREIYDKQVAQKEEMRKKFREMVAKDEKRIDDFISSQSPETLDQPAVISNTSTYYNWQFVEPAMSAYRLVYIDQSYFDKTLPSYFPQFITMAWYWADDTAPLYFKKQFEENFPLHKLQAMIDQYGSNIGNSRQSDDIKNKVESIVHSATGPNNPSTWNQVKYNIDEFLSIQWRNGKLIGSTSNQAFYVKVDNSTMTQNDIQQGRMIVEIGIAPVKPAEFVIFRATKQL